jgi:hypothetical protein
MENNIKWAKARTIAYWITTAVIALETGAGAEWDLVKNPYVRQIFSHLNYPEYLLTILGAWKVLAFVALLIPGFPRLKEWTYAGLFFVYFNAVVSHIFTGDGASVWMGPLVFSGITLISWALRPQSRRLGNIIGS